MPDHQVTPEGVNFETKERARLYADLFDKDVVEIAAGWQAKNRKANAPPMETKEGDVVIFHLHQLYRVWVTTWDGAQGGDPNVAPSDFWNADEAEAFARKWVEETNGRIFRLQKDGNWTLAPGE